MPRLSKSVMVRPVCCRHGGLATRRRVSRRTLMPLCGRAELGQFPVYRPPSRVLEGHRPPPATPLFIQRSPDLWCLRPPTVK